MNLSSLHKKTSAHGFTLIELLVVIAIIGLLSTIIAAPIQSARKKARDAKKIAELKSTQLALEQYAESNKAEYPTSLGLLSPQFMPLLSSFASSTTSNQRDAFAYTYYKARAEGGATTTFSYHIGAKLEVYGPALETDRDCIFATLYQFDAPLCAAYNGNHLFAWTFNNGSQIVGAAASTTWAPSIVTTSGNPLDDIGGADFEQATNPYFQVGISASSSWFAEISTSTCVIVNECIFDTTSQQ